MQQLIDVLKQLLALLQQQHALKNSNMTANDDHDAEDGDDHHDGEDGDDGEDGEDGDDGHDDEDAN